MSTTSTTDTVDSLRERLDPAQRSLFGRLGAASLHAQGKTNTAPARAALQAKFLREVDPDEVLPEAERQRRATHARKAYYTRLAMKSAQARRAKKQRT